MMMKHTTALGSLLAAMLLSAQPAAVSAQEFNEALKSAYETNPRIKAQRRALEQTNERVSQSIGAFRPTVTASYQDGRQRTRFDTPKFSTGDTETKTLSVTQPIFQGGENIFRYFGAKDRMYSSRHSLNAFEQEVMLDAVAAYMDVVQNFSVLELSRNNENVLAKQLEASRNRFEVGDVTRTDVAQSEARRSRATSDRIQAEGDLESSLAQFERVIGFRPENLPLPIPDLAVPIPATLEEAIDYAVANNPSLRAAESSVDAADNDIGVAAARILPRVSLVGTANRQKGAGVLGSSDFDSDSLVVSVSVPIYQNGSEYSVVRESTLLSRQREFDLTDTQQAVREATIQAWENLQTSIATIEAQEEAIRAAQIALDGVRKEQQYGARTILDVLDAEQELFIAQVELVRAQRNRQVSAYNLLLILGDMSVDKLGLDVKAYDPEEHYDSVKWQLIGF